jgi:hypothetical protein
MPESEYFTIIRFDVAFFVICCSCLDRIAFVRTTSAQHYPSLATTVPVDVLSFSVPNRVLQVPATAQNYVQARKPGQEVLVDSPMHQTVLRMFEA